MAEPKYLVPMSSPEITSEDRQCVMEVLHTPSLSIGPKLDEFETAFKRFTGSLHAVGVSSGTAGLHLCVRAAGVQPHDYVITTPFSFVSSANVILFENAIPVFVDVDLQTGNIDTELVAQAAADLASGDVNRSQRWLPRQGVGGTGVLRAFLTVDVFGQPADYDSLRAIAQSYHIKLIEDSCEALGAEYKHLKAGTLGDFGVFAFYPNKQITTGEGGMVITSDIAAADFMRALRNQGRAPGDTWLQHTYLGYNYRLDELSAALGLSQMRRLEELLRKRQQVAKLYANHLIDIPEVDAPFVAPSTTHMSWFVYVIRVKRGLDRDTLAANLEREGIPVRPYFLPIHLQPYMLNRFGFQIGDFPITEELGNRGLALPFSGLMTEEQVDLVCRKIKKCLTIH